MFVFLFFVLVCLVFIFFLFAYVCFICIDYLLYRLHLFGSVLICSDVLLFHL